MHCAVRLCGHCQLGPLFVCADGPVVTLGRRLHRCWRCGDGDHVEPAPAPLAVWKFASCDGCQLTLLDCEDELLAVADGCRSPTSSRRRGPTVEGPYDLSLVEGSITTAHDVERIAEIRAASRRLVTIGACATAGGIQALRNFADIDEYVGIVYATPSYISTLATSTPISAHVPVDFELRGCPIDRRQLLEVIAAFLGERRPNVPGHSVCVECKLRGNVCVMVADGTPCLGPITHAGCGALCPTLRPGLLRLLRTGRGPEPGVARPSSSTRLGVERVDLVRMLRTFNADAAPFRDESARLAADGERADDRRPDAERTFTVDALARVEGEGAMHVVIRDGRVRDVQLRIYEPPRFFEALLRGRAYTEPPDITARICGICPVAYQMSACNAIEAAVRRHGRRPARRAAPPPVLRRVDREPHPAHLPAPRPRLPRLRERHRPRRPIIAIVVQRGLDLKKIGNELVELVGGRAIHPVNVRVGGFYRVPTGRELPRLRAPARAGPRPRARDRPLGRRLRLPRPRHGPASSSRSRHPASTPITRGRLVSTRGLDIGPEEFDHTSSRSTSSTRPRSTPVSSTVASTSSVRWPASP